MHGFALALARFALALWIGAATLFVITGVREVTDPGISSETRDRLVAVRFPPYYIFGAASLLTAQFSLLAGAFGRSKGVRFYAAFVLMGVATLLMAWDYVYVYLPLVELITPPGQPRTEVFMQLHEMSKWVNAAGLALALAACVLIPGEPGARRKTA